MSATDTWMPQYIGDFLADTLHLSTEHIGAYQLLLWHQWNKGAVPDDDQQLATICRTTIGRWRKRLAPLLRPFFAVTECGLVQKRAAEEKAIASDISEVRSKAGAEGARIRWQKERERRAAEAAEREAQAADSNVDGKPMANGMAPQCQTDAHTHPPLQLDDPSLRSGWAPAAPVAEGRRGVRDELWDDGTRLMTLMTGKPEKSARAMLGQLLMEAKDDCAMVLDLVRQAERDRVLEPMAWLVAAVRQRMGKRPLRPGSRPPMKNGFFALAIRGGMANPAADGVAADQPRLAAS